MKMYRTFGKTAALVAGCLFICSVQPSYSAPQDWKQTLSNDLPLLGHRNWIAIVDSAYPLQARPGIQTIVANDSETNVLKTALADIAASRHVRPIIYEDAELHYLTDAEAPGVNAYRISLSRILANRSVNRLLHEQIIAKLDDAGKTFNILIIKTNMTIPYTSVFLQLNCKYWSDANEKLLRASMPPPSEVLSR